MLPGPRIQEVQFVVCIRSPHQLYIQKGHFRGWCVCGCVGVGVGVGVGVCFCVCIFHTCRCPCLLLRSSSDLLLFP